MRLYKIALTILIAFLATQCSQKEALTYYKIQGFAQGSTYSISYSWDGGQYDMQNAIDSLLNAFDASLSNYKPQSIISLINAGDTNTVLDEWFIRFWNDSKLVYEKTDGAFDITVSPVVNFWGFGYSTLPEKDSSVLDSLMQFVGMDKIAFEDSAIRLPQGMSVISNAIAQGLSVDIMCEFFDSKGIENYLVEIGGELRCKGLSNTNKLWTVGIDKPIDTLTQRELEAAVPLNNKSLATSGNYRKFYEKDGVKYSHTIDPKTGYPVRHQLLSATVIAPTCSMADAYATACMVKGLEWSKEFADRDSTIDVMLIFATESGETDIYTSEGFPKSVL